MKRRRLLMLLSACAGGLAVLATAPAVMAQTLSAAGPGVKTTYFRLPGNANALLTDPAQPDARQRIVVINVHPGKINAFEYGVGRQLVARGYRQIGVNYYGPEVTFEELLPPIGAAVRYARTIPGVEKVVLVGHSGGGPELSFYAEIVEKGPAACQQPNRIYKCDSKGLTDLPKVDGIVLMEANIGAPHRTFSIDPAVDTRSPKVRNPALDIYAAANGFDPTANAGAYSAAFTAKYHAGQHARSERLIAEAKAKRPFGNPSAMALWVAEQSETRPRPPQIVGFQRFWAPRSGPRQANLRVSKRSLSSRRSRTTQAPTMTTSPWSSPAWPRTHWARG